MCKEDDLSGHALCNQFNNLIILTENNRLNHTDPDAVIFDKFLDRLRDSAHANLKA